MTGERKRTSYSRVSTYEGCPVKGYKRYDLGLRGQSSVPLHVGSSVHAAAEANNTQKIVTREDLTEEELVDVGADEFMSRVEIEGVALSKDEQTIGEKKVVGQAKDQVISLCKLYASDVAPLIQPQLSEQAFSVPIDSINTDLIVIVDVLSEDFIMPDLKTAKARKPALSVHSDMQLSMGALAIKQHFGRYPEEVGFDVLVKSKDPVAQILRSTRDDSDSIVALNHIVALNDMIEAGTYIPAAPGWWGCGQTCEFWTTCEFVNSERIEAARLFEEGKLPVKKTRVKKTPTDKYREWIESELYEKKLTKARERGVYRVW